MKDSGIGIKVADGTLYPILEEGFQGKKRLIVTTVRDNQSAVQIDLYRGPGEAAGDAGGITAETAEYIGSLIIDNIPPMARGLPEIEVVLGLDANGNLEATASDRATGEVQSLAVSLESLGPDSTYEIPEFAIEDGAIAPESSARPALDLEDELLTGETYPVGRKDSRREHLERRRRSPLLIALFVVAALLLMAALAFLIVGRLGGSLVIPLPGRSEPAAEEVSAASEEPARPAPAAASSTDGTSAATENPAPAEGPAMEMVPVAAPAASPEPVAPPPEPVPPPAPATPPPEAAPAGVWYKIVWGDTLWDISATYYRNPWLYPRIARANRIKNPDLIIAGTRILIPEN